ncbi:MAG: type II toxin-antitoxin system HicB family antitoxin [Nanoarchaeota archaeon]
MEKLVLSAVLKKEEDMFVAECSEVGTVSQGASIEEALENLREATELYLEEFPLVEDSKPIVTFFEVPKHAKIQKYIGA